MKFKVISVLVMICMLLTGFTFLTPLSSVKAAVPGIVYTQGTKFVMDGFPFYYAGCNSYDLFTYGDGYNDSTPELIESKYMDKAGIDKRMSDMAADGIKVLRTWGFSHEKWHGFEKQKGVYNEAQFMEFDYIMESAKKYGIKVIITLENYWEAYGGIDTRLAWEGLSGVSHANRAKFFTHPGCKQGYKDYIDYFVTRVNHYTGIPYKDDPTLFAWELMNEPRYQDAGENSTGTTLRAWVDEMAGYIKSLDPNHMISLGIEGHESKYGFGGDEGNPFIYTQQSPYIDFCTAHPYPDEAWANLSAEQSATLVEAWINDAHNVVGKPFVLEEFNTHKNKESYWNAMFAKMESLDAAGDNFWNYNSKSTSDFDLLHGDPLLGTVFKTHADKMAAKNSTPVHAPLTFNQSSPLDGATGLLLRPVFKWAPSVGAQSYNLMVSASSNMTNPVINITGIKATQYIPTVDLGFGTKYYWKVTAVNSLGNMPASNSGISFTTRSAPTAAPGSFNQALPMDTSVGVTTKPSFSWAESNQALSYNLIVSANSDFSSPVINITGLTETAYTSATALALNTKYYWKVTAVNTLGSTTAANSGMSFVTVDLPPVDTTVKVQGSLLKLANTESQLAVKVMNTGAGALDKFAARIYLDLSEVYSAGYTYSNVVTEKFYDQTSGKTTITGPFAWDAAKKTYYLQINWNDFVLPSGNSIEQHFRIRLDGWQACWDSANDYCTTGLKDSFADTQYIPLYRGNTKMWGTDPGQTAVPTPTPTVVPTQTPTPSIVPTPTSTATSDGLDFNVETSFEPSKLVANQMITAKVKAINTSAAPYDGLINVLLLVGLYDSNNTMVNVSYISKGIAFHGTETLSAGFKLPRDITGYSVKAFMWDGEDIKTSNMIPLSNVTQLP